MEYYRKNIVLIEREPKETKEIVDGSSNEFYSKPSFEKIEMDQNRIDLKNKRKIDRSSNISLNRINSENNFEDVKIEMNLTDYRLFRIFLLV